MKNTLLFNYNLDIDDIQKVQNDIYTFYIDYNKFYFMKVNRSNKDIEFLFDLLSKTINKYHYIIKNNKNQFLTEYEKKDYILLKINGSENNEIDIFDILNDQIIVTQKPNMFLLRNNWGDLWSSKVDYLEYQVSELGKNHKIITNSFSYYVGLAENAIQYFNILKVDPVQLAYSHKRVVYPNYSINFYNPLNIIIDYRVRDIAEYLKFSFFKGNDVLNDLNILLNKNIFSPLELNLLYSRLLFPTYYFDLITLILEGKANDEDLLVFIEKVNEYEMFLKNAYLEMAKYAELFKIDWIVGK